LEQDVRDDTSGDFRDILLELIKGNRDEVTSVDQAAAQKDAENLYQRGENKIGTDDEGFIKLFTSRSVAHIRAVAVIYKNNYHKSLEEAIISETSFNYQKTLIALLKTPAEHFADACADSIVGVGTNNRRLLRALICSDTKEKKKELRDQYRERCGRYLEVDISNDTSFHFKQTLMEMIGFGYT